MDERFIGFAAVRYPVEDSFLPRFITSLETKQKNILKIHTSNSVALKFWLSAPIFGTYYIIYVFRVFYLFATFYTYLTETLS